jgi:hypothetical protein
VPGLDPALSQLVLTLMEKDPDERFPSAAELLAALNAASSTTDKPPTRQAVEAPAAEIQPTLTANRRHFWEALLERWRASLVPTAPAQQVWMHAMKRTLSLSAQGTARRPADAPPADR